ncbi:type I-C CRISPR-associated protein Cas8c/Csd1 [Gluconacetobacter diazotrophicus]|uniref:CRISPR-associated protein, Csd1 family n=2 Tax=Gluconacetobacter diazotrophicus (strain ATCC 49037 / DSM 5601 / CCUG 37298 / CIP 103539 / LMG 7603 / PAl5) TaxID=272568 RepID=A9GZV1_GLUDA|nr:type I-C CRISPR-associated protein Cas8c/Csd1 [Gluconacetobacter diazotrophicus]CAP54005.1 conserved hypothetical protein [Gluconacetobacter diazotrophicus PA1 5]
MTIQKRPGPLEALVDFYARMDDAEDPGWGREKFGWCVVIDAEGQPIDVLDQHDHDGRKPRPRLFLVPAAVKRASGIAPNFLWDKTSYVLGRTAGAGKRTAQEHEAFVAFNLKRMAETSDVGLVAFRRFLERWTPAQFDTPLFPAEMLDANIMFRLEGDRDYLHRRPAAQRLVEAALDNGHERQSFCLVTGQRAAPARLHPTIKGVEGAQTSGASLVSFNLDAFCSYDRKQGDNAPTSQAAAFRYGAALNRLLTRDGPNRLRRPIGDATVIFWADGSDAQVAKKADAWIQEAIAPNLLDADAARRIGEELTALAQGRPLSQLRPDIPPDTRFYVMGLSPNAARLSVRFWLSDSLDVFAHRLAEHYEDTRIAPSPWSRPPTVNLLLARTVAAQDKYDNIPPLLAGEIMRAILTGTPYPRTWLAAILMRLRAGDDPATGWHAAALRAVLQRRRRLTKNASDNGDVPVSLNRDYPSIGYQLGRLFAVYELAQRAALGIGVKATMRDKYFAAASAAPASIFPVIIRNSQNHLSNVRKRTPGWAGVIERELDEIFGRITPSGPHVLPRALSLEHQGEFAIGYYHQRRERIGGRMAETALQDDEQDIEDNATHD